MGYTHYWRKQGEIEQSKYEAGLAACRELIAKSPVALEDRSKNGNISINGVEPEDCEDLYLPAKASDLQSFDFCKTRQHPYDTIVTACLAVMRDAIGPGFYVGSDGDAVDWVPGLQFATEVIGREIKIPPLGEDDD